MGLGFRAWGLGFIFEGKGVKGLDSSCLECQGDVVSRLLNGISRVTRTSRSSSAGLLGSIPGVPRKQADSS